MAKPKRKRSIPTSKRKRSSKPFLGDHIYAVLNMLSCGCLTVTLGMISLVSIGLTSAMKFNNDSATIGPTGWSYHGPFESKIRSRSEQITQRGLGYALATISALGAVICVWYVVALWMGRKWAYWLAFAIQVPCAFAGVWMVFSAQTPVDGLSIFSWVLAFYVTLRVTGLIGPRM
jgi:hypothetical protein